EDMHKRIAGAFPFMEGAALLDSEWRKVQCRDVFPFLVDADLIKIDIEGGEWEILADPRLEELRAVAIVLEYHPLYCANGDPEQVVRDSLRRVSYRTAAPIRGYDAGMMWAWKPAGDI